VRSAASEERFQLTARHRVGVGRERLIVQLDGMGSGDMR
jgi:hypothetical protein